MKLFSHFLRLVSGAVCLLLLCGCVNFEYTGRAFAPLKQGKVPAWYQSKKQLPAGKYTIIGRAVIESGLTADMEDLQERLLEEAASRGADAVCLVSAETVYKGLYAEDSYYAGPSSNWTTPFNLTPDGAPIQTDLAGERITQNADSINFAGERGAAKRLIVKVLFLKETAALEKFRAERREHLDNLIQSPAPTAAKESASEKK